MAYEIHVDVAKNRLYLTLVGLLSDDEARAAATASLAGFHKLRPRFTVVTDITQCRPMSQAGVGEIKRVGAEGIKLGMLATCRVVGASAVAKMQFERATQEAGFVSYHAATRADAEALLDAAVAGKKP